MRALYDVPAPAKINTFLHIVGRRADGYHLLQSVFALLDWCDTLHFETRPGPQLSREDLGAALPADDLCLRAARTLQAATGCTRGAHITVAKVLPSEAGLGGGSSDCATTLLALNRLWQLGLTRTELSAIGLQLGADVPFFLFGRNAWAEGVGEQLQAVDLPPTPLVVAKPAAGVSTAALFTDPRLCRNTGLAILAGFLEAGFSFGHNDLQPVAQILCPQIEEAVRWLDSQGLQARMTGSGSAVFAPLTRPLGTDPVPNGLLLHTCSTLPEHPLRAWAEG
jgi:4-diphosphocytidyl-2-C-methyl-D-erythritol kinase